MTGHLRSATRSIASMAPILALGACGAGAGVSGSTAAPARPAPGLLVVVVVDQFRYDLLERYADLWSGGLARLRSQGLRFTQVTHDHAVTETAPGHATLGTGVHPSRHGIVSNGWTEPDSTGWRTVENVVDPAAPLVGAEQFAGASPRRLMRPGLADWLRAAEPSARVVSIAGKDRAAVLLASQSQGVVYWYEPRVARFVTSTWYRDKDLKWVSRFNETRLLELLADSVWESTVPATAVARARPDEAFFEGDGIHVTFPHRRNEEEEAAGQWLARTPDLDVATVDLALTAVRELDLGQGGHLDYLAVGLSQTDRVGHAFGPLSLEQLDNLLRLDRELGRLLEELERLVPQGRLKLAVSSDHGVLEVPEWRARQGLPGRRLGAPERDQFSALVRRGLQASPSPAVAMSEALVEMDWIDDAWLRDHTPSDSLGVLATNATYPGRFAKTLERYGVGYRLTEGTLDWVWARGTTHGSPYYYDRHVPLVFYGGSVHSGERSGRTSTADVAPTLARWAGIPFPSDLDGVARDLRVADPPR